MRFLFINQYYAPDYAATAQLLSDACEKLAAEGHEVTVIASQSLYDGRHLTLPARETLNGVDVYRVPLVTSSRRRFRDRIYGYLSFYVGAFWRACTVPRPDVVVTLTTPPLIALLGIWMRLVRGSRFVFWVMDVYPEIAERAGVLRKARPVLPLWKALSGLTYRLAHRVIVLGDNMRQSLIARGVKPRKVLVVPTWSCGKEVRPVDGQDNSFRVEHLRPERFTLMYSGNMGACHTFEAVIQGIDLLKGSDTFDFVFVGSGKKEEQLRKKLAHHNGHVRFLPYQDRTRLAESLSAPEAHLVTLDPRFDGLLVPSKLYGIMAAGRPVLFVGSRDNEVARTIESARCGVVVAPDDHQGFANAVQWLRDNPGELRAMGERGRAAFEQNYEREAVCGALMDVLVAEGNTARGHVASRTPEPEAAEPLAD